MTMVDELRDGLRINDIMTAREYDALPQGSRIEIVDGVLRPMAPPIARHQWARSELRIALKRVGPADVLVLDEIEVRFADDPVHARIPDVVVVRASGFDFDAPRIRPAQAVLVAEVVSPGSGQTDRSEKPVEYASAGIEHYWRVELKPVLVVHTFRLGEQGHYLESGLFKSGDIVDAPGLRWARVSVTDLEP